MCPNSKVPSSSLEGHTRARVGAEDVVACMQLCLARRDFTCRCCHCRFCHYDYHHHHRTYKWTPLLGGSSLAGIVIIVAVIIILYWKWLLLNATRYVSVHCFCQKVGGGVVNFWRLSFSFPGPPPTTLPLDCVLLQRFPSDCSITTLMFKYHNSCDFQVDRHSAPGGPGGPGAWKDNRSPRGWKDDQDSVYLESNCVDDVRWLHWHLCKHYKHHHHNPHKHHKHHHHHHHDKGQAVWLPCSKWQDTQNSGQCFPGEFFNLK